MTLLAAARMKRLPAIVLPTPRKDESPRQHPLPHLHLDVPHLPEGDEEKDNGECKEGDVHTDRPVGRR